MSVFKRPDSSVWQYEFEMAGTRYRGSTGKKSRTEAIEFEVDRRREVKDDLAALRLGVKRSTLEEIAKQWLEASKREHLDFKNNQSRVRKLFGRELVKVGDEWVEREGARFGLKPDTLIHEINQAMLMELRNKRREEGNSGGTINIEMSLLQALLGYAKDSGVVMPATDIVWQRKKNKVASLKSTAGPGKLRWLRPAEESALLLALSAVVDTRPEDQSAIDAYHLVMFLLDTGARYNEIAKIKWDMIDLAEGTINLYRRKVGNESTLHLPARTWGMLKMRWDSMKDLGYSYVFPALKGRAWAMLDKPRGHATGSIQRHMDALGFNDDLKDGRATPHTFRDTFASKLVQAGVSLLKVSHLLGHKDVTMTKKYAHLDPNLAGREAAMVLDMLVNKSTQGDDPNANRPQGSPHVLPHGSGPHAQQSASLPAANDSQVVDSKGEIEDGVVGRARLELTTYGLKERTTE
jgi:integrase